MEEVQRSSKTVFDAGKCIGGNTEGTKQPRQSKDRKQECLIGDGTINIINNYNRKVQAVQII